MFDTLFQLLQDFALWCLDSILSLVTGLLSGLDSLFSALDVIQYINMIPFETMAVMQLVGISTCSSMITTAILIRLTLKLIPFVRF
jgi:putative effector of murein hydrolase LrgA (UPF0299 family)